jgi:hypothetical protein
VVEDTETRLDSPVRPAAIVVAHLQRMTGEYEARHGEIQGSGELTRQGKLARLGDLAARMGNELHRRFRIEVRQDALSFYAALARATSCSWKASCGVR